MDGVRDRRVTLANCGFDRATSQLGSGAALSSTESVSAVRGRFWLYRAERAVALDHSLCRRVYRHGPVVAVPEGIKYFTMRSVCETGLVPISNAREKMLRGPKRHAQYGPIDISSEAVLQALTDAQTEAVIPLAEDGLGAEVIHLPGALKLLPQRLAASAGFFLVVLAGTLIYADGQLGALENVFVSADEVLPVFSSGKEGLQVLVLHLPRKELVYP